MKQNQELYQPPPILFNRHLETIFPSLLRSVEVPLFSRERIATPDQDFLDLDWLRQGSDKLVIISHGLEGSSDRPYIKGMARAFFNQGYDVLAWNFRGCSSEMNRQSRFYHSGATDDLEVVVTHAQISNYSRLYLIGFSLGGNLTLKYLGETDKKTRHAIAGAVAISVPLDLHASCLEISKPHNWLYSQRFLKSLKKKIVQKAVVNNELNAEGIENIRTLIEFDDRYTSVLHGFTNAVDYYSKCSSLNFLHAIECPTLLINAKNDPFLSASCYPQQSNPAITHVYPDFGGHVGFTLFNQNGLYWSELRSLQFIDALRS